jgi:Zn finger protein HypA/HybF involved in hydrogenase expression
MPILQAEIDFQVFCRIYGEGICHNTVVEDKVLTVTCPSCKSKITGLEAEKECLNAQFVKFSLGKARTTA